jgi:hypothetical protein
MWKWRLLALAGVAMLCSAQAQAQATRTWVSGVGDDINPCSRTAPCKTFAGAISKTAAGGEINCLDPAGYGAVTITESIAIQCDGTVGGVLAAGTIGITVNALATDTVYLSGLDINGAGTGTTGINFIRGGALHVRNSAIRGFLTNGINFAPGAGPAATAKLVVQDSLVADNPNAGTAGGILIKPALTFNAVATLTNVHADRNLFGVKAEDRSKVTVFNSSASGNINNGITALSTTHATGTGHCQHGFRQRPGRRARERRISDGSPAEFRDRRKRQRRPGGQWRDDRRDFAGHQHDRGQHLRAGGRRRDHAAIDPCSRPGPWGRGRAIRSPVTPTRRFPGADLPAAAPARSVP